MSNVTVQEALKATIETITALCNGSLDPLGGAYKTVNQCKAALAEIEKCEPVGVVDVESNTGAKLTNSIGLTDGDLLYTSPQPRDCEDWQYFDKAYKKATESSEPDDWMNAALMAQQVRRRILDTSPQPRDWVNLSDMQITNIAMQHQSLHQVAYAISDALKQLNTKG